MLWSSKILVPANQRPLSLLATHYTLWRPPAHPPAHTATDDDTLHSHDLSHPHPALISRRPSATTHDKPALPSPGTRARTVVQRPGADHGPNNAQDASQSRSRDGPPPVIGRLPLTKTAQIRKGRRGNAVPPVEGGGRPRRSFVSQGEIDRS